MSTLLLRLHSVAACIPSRCTGSSCTLGMEVRTAAAGSSTKSKLLPPRLLSQLSSHR